MDADNCNTQGIIGLVSSSLSCVILASRGYTNHSNDNCNVYDTITLLVNAYNLQTKQYSWMGISCSTCGSSDITNSLLHKQ